MDRVPLALRSALVIASSLAACSSRSTQVLVHLDTNVDRARAVSLSIVSRAGVVSADALRPTAVEPLRSTAERPLFPGSATLVPASAGARSGVQTVLLRFEVAQSATQPALLIERLHQVQLIERTPLETRVFFNADCAAASTGCALVAPADCTLSRRCLERGLTCGDDGECVPIELPTALASGDASVVDRVARDATTFDSVADRPADAAADAAADSGEDASVEPPPRLIAPVSTSSVSSQRPTLALQLEGSATALIELCRDRAMTASCVELPASSARVRPVAPLAAGWWFWRARTVTAMRRSTLTSATWQMLVPRRSADGDRDTRSGAAADFNGDGVSEIVVGAPGALTGGEAAVLSAVATNLVEPGGARVRGAAGDGLGFAVAAIGDVNGDGFGDLAIGSPGADAQRGAVRVRFGGPSGLGSIADQTLTGTTATGRFGASIAGLGDIDGDGYGDFAVGAPNGGPGSVLVLRGGATGVTTLRSIGRFGRGAGDTFGWSVASAGDLNGDGLADMIVGAPGADRAALVDVGEAHVLLGSVTGDFVTTRVIDGFRDGDGFGFSVANAGDVNGDGYSDVLIGVHNGGTVSQGDGVAYAFYGDASLAGVTIGATLHGQNSERFGWSVASAGDVNGDGFSDVIVGAWAATPMAMQSAGAARVFHGSPTGLTVTAAREWLGALAGDALGTAVAGVGDLNGDGYDEVVVGSPSNRPSATGRAGAIQVFRGSATGSQMLRWTGFGGTFADDSFGVALASSR